MIIDIQMSSVEAKAILENLRALRDGAHWHKVLTPELMNLWDTLKNMGDDE